jgi:hypothetical protein
MRFPIRSPAKADLRTQSYFKNVMSAAFSVSAYWYRQEFAKSRGMVHWHGLCWRSDREPHNLLHNAIEDNSEQSYKGKVKTHNYINRQNQSTTGKL